MVRVFASGPELAERTGEMLARTPRAPGGDHAAVRGGAARPARQALAADEDLFALAYLVVAATVLAAADYPGWRIAILALAAAVQQAGLPHLPEARLKLCVNADSDQIARFVVAGQASLLLTTWVAVPSPAASGARLLITFVGGTPPRSRRSGTVARRASCSPRPPSAPARSRSCRAADRPELAGRGARRAHRRQRPRRRRAARARARCDAQAANQVRPRA